MNHPCNVQSLRVAWPSPSPLEIGFVGLEDCGRFGEAMGSEWAYDLLHAATADELVDWVDHDEGRRLLVVAASGHDLKPVVGVARARVHTVALLTMAEASCSDVFTHWFAESIQQSEQEHARAPFLALAPLAHTDLASVDPLEIYGAYEAVDGVSLFALLPPLLQGFVV